MLQQIDHSHLLRSIPWFMDLNPDQLDRLAAIAETCHAEPGEVLFHEGDRKGRLYIVIEGQVEITYQIPSRGQLAIFTAEPLDIIGWSSMTPIVRQLVGSAVAKTNATLLSFDGGTLRLLCDEDHDLGYVIMRRLANVIASRLLVTRLTLTDLLVHEKEEAARPQS